MLDTIQRFEYAGACKITWLVTSGIDVAALAEGDFCAVKYFLRASENPFSKRQNMRDRPAAGVCVAELRRPRIGWAWSYFPRPGKRRQVRRAGMLAVEAAISTALRRKP
jgi:hypothetical protein